jgi:hypothetical protein
MSNVIESILKKSPKKVKSRTISFTTEFYQKFKWGLIVLLKLLLKYEKDRQLFHLIIWGQYYHDTKLKGATKTKIKLNINIIYEYTYKTLNKILENWIKEHIKNYTSLSNVSSYTGKGEHMQINKCNMSL